MTPSRPSRVRSILAGVFRRTRAVVHTLGRYRWLLVCLGVGLGILLVWLSRTLPRRALDELGRLTHTHITAQDVTLAPQGQVRIQGLQVRPLVGAVYDNTLLRAEDVTVHFSWGSLWRRRPRIKRIHLQGVQCDLIYDPNTGTWNAQTLRWPMGSGGAGGLPEVSCTAGSLRYARVLRETPQQLLNIPMDCNVAADPLQDKTLAFTLDMGPIAQGFGSSHLQGRWRKGSLSLVGGLSQQDVNGQKRMWSIPMVAAQLNYDPGGRFVFNFKAEQAQAWHSHQDCALAWLSPVLSETSGILTRIQEFVDRYHPAGRVNFDLDVEGQWQAWKSWKIAGTANCLDVTINDQRFPYLLEHLQGDITITENCISTDGLKGMHKDTKVHLDFYSRDFGPNWQYQVHMACEDMPLEPDLYKAIPPHYQRLWDRLSPTGSVWIDNCITRHAATKKTRLLRIRPVKTRAAYRDFPYPLEQLSGELQIDQGGAKLKNISATRGESRIVLNGTVVAAKNHPPIVDINIAAQGIDFDETLAKAIPPSLQATYQQLQLQGKTDAAVHIFTPAEANSPTTYQARLQAQDVAFRPPGWQQRLQDAAFKVMLTPTEMSIDSLQARSGKSPIAIQGKVRFGSDKTLPHYRLKLHSEAFAAEDLIAGLPSDTRQSLGHLQARGPLALTGSLHPLPGRTDPNYSIRLDCRKVQAQPWFWPYPLRDITGILHLENDQVVVESLQGRPHRPAAASAQVNVSGTLHLQNNQCTEAELRVSAQAFPLDTGLLGTLPSPLRQSLEPLTPSGTLSLEPSTIHLRELTQNKQLQFQGRLHLTTGQLSLKGKVIDLNDLFLDLNLDHEQCFGFHKGQVHVSAGQMSLEGKAVTEMQTQLQYHRDLDAWIGERVTGRFYEGLLLGHLHLQLTPNAASQLHLQIGLHDADLYPLLQACRTTKPVPGEPSQGLLAGSLSLGIHPANETICIGRCQLTIQNMKVGARSPLAQVLSGVRGYATDDIHFDRLFVEAYLQNEMLQFKRFDIAGRSLALQGTGHMNLSKEEIYLDLITRGRRLPTSNPTVLQSLSEGLGGAVMRLEVTGNPMQPVVNTRTLPVIEDSLRLLGSKR